MTDTKPNQNIEKIILGIDPGTNFMGYAIISIQRNTPRLIDMDALDLRKSLDSYLKLDAIYRAVTSLVEKHLPDEMAIEAPFYGKNVQSMLKLGRAQGVAMAAALARQVPITEYEPKKVKMAVTGNGNASKEQIKEMVTRLLNIPEEFKKKKLDASDALAIALCHFYESGKVVSVSPHKSWSDFIANNPQRVKKR